MNFFIRHFIFTLLVWFSLTSGVFAQTGIAIAEPKLLGVNSKRAEVKSRLRGFCEKVFHDDDRFEIRGSKDDLKKAIKEWELAMSGLAGEEEFELKIPGVDYFILPVFWVHRGVKIITMRVMDAHTCKLVASQTGITPGRIDRDLVRVISQLRGKIPLAKSSTPATSRKKSPRIAVLGFKEKTGLAQLSEALLAGQFCLDNRVETIERENLAYALEERQLVSAGLAENKRSLEGEFADVLRVGLAVQGSVFKAKEQGFISLYLKLIDIKSGTIKATAYGECPDEKNLPHTLNKLSQRLLNIYFATGEIRAESTPANAEVFLDGYLEGYTPLTIRGINPGAYELVYSLENYHLVDKVVNVGRGKRLIDQVRLELISPLGRMEISTIPPRAKIWIDGEGLGTSPVNRDNIEVGIYTVKAAKEGYKPTQRKVKVEANQTATVKMRLERVEKKKPVVTTGGDWWHGLSDKWKRIFNKELQRGAILTMPSDAELAKLANLTSLNLGYNQISDISPLAKLNNLTSLDLRNNQISDISPLAKLNNLTSLDLRNNQISDISPLAKLANLTSLNLWNNQISDISPLAKLNNLTSLYLGGNQISDISPLAKLNNLTELHLGGNQISDISPLAKLNNLTSLDLGGNQISDISPLAKLNNLTSLDLGGNQISDISPLAKLNNLTSLNLWNNQISDISPLAKLNNLTSLYLWNNQISDISPLAKLNNLTSLDLGYNQISDISPLAKLNNLTSLNLWNNQISDISPLAKLNNLTSLYLWNNQISDISTLAKLDNLTGLFLDGIIKLAMMT